MFSCITELFSIEKKLFYFCFPYNTLFYVVLRWLFTGIITKVTDLYPDFSV